MSVREILFRGKRLDNGKWVDGYYIPDGDKAYIGQSFGMQFYEVDAYTVGQYTGLTDRNGKRIWEGDIVRYGDNIHLAIFEKRAGNAYFGIVMDEQETWGFCPSVPSNKMEVIGNIHDNPELLERGRE